MVFLCHDINDIFLEAAKMARYAQQKTAPNVLFVAFMLSWFASRIFYFPVYLIRSVYYEPIEVRCMKCKYCELSRAYAHDVSVVTCFMQAPHPAHSRLCAMQQFLPKCSALTVQADARMFAPVHAH